MENSIRDNSVKRDYFRICLQYAKLVEKLSFNNVLEELIFICKFIGDSAILSTNEELPSDFEMPEDFKPGMLVMTGQSTEYHILELTLDILRLRGYDVDTINVFMDFDGEYEDESIDISSLESNCKFGTIKYENKIYAFDSATADVFEIIEGPIIKSYIYPESLICMSASNEEESKKVESYRKLVDGNKKLSSSEDEISNYINNVNNIFFDVNLDNIVNDIFNYENIMQSLKKGADSNNRPKDLDEYKQIIEKFLVAITNSGILDNSKKYNKLVRNLGKAVIEFNDFEEEYSKEIEGTELEVSDYVNSFVESMIEKCNIQFESSKYGELEALMNEVKQLLTPTESEKRKIEIAKYGEFVEPHIKAIMDEGIINDIDAILNIELSARKDIDKPTVYQLVRDYYYRMRVYLKHVSKGTIESGKRYVRKRQLTIDNE